MPELKRNIFQRIFGIPATKTELSPDQYSMSNETITVYLDKVPQLKEKANAVKLTANGTNIITFLGVDGQYHALHNKCTHAGRQLDPMNGKNAVQCCSVGKTMIDYEGNVIKGQAGKTLCVFDTKTSEGNLIIDYKKPE